ncbi:MAG: ferrous iron transporter B, partial [Clostridia bacterium]|nr:ferrous iron transporter B [Clostridia bacterium]
VEDANTQSEMLSSALFCLGGVLRALLADVGAHPLVVGALIDGVYNTTAWVVGVMLPPMAIFFPLFTVLEDLGYLPRVAFNLDGAFRRCGSCGKQALTMCLT